MKAAYIPRRRLAAASLALAAALALGEAALRLWLAPAKPTRHHGIAWVHPTRGFSLLPSSRFLSEGVPYTTNSDGFRDREFLPEAGSIRVLFLGDSFVEGLGLEQAQALPSRLERTLSRRVAGLRVLNCGIRGGSPAAYRLWIEDLGALRPSVVVIGVFDNDLAEDVLAESDAALIEARWLQCLPRWLQPLHLARLPARLDLRPRSRKEGLSHRLGVAPRKRARPDSPHPHFGFYFNPRRWRPAWEQTRTHLASLADRIRELEATPILVYLPLLCTLPNRPCHRSFFGRRKLALPLRDWLMELCAEQSLDCLDTSPLLRERDEAGLSSFLRNGHLDTAGCDAVANALAPRVLAALHPKAAP
jgi:lysophospholipase L1-like esterase